jgi:hypothetical protein
MFSAAIAPPFGLGTGIDLGPEPTAEFEKVSACLLETEGGSGSALCSSTLSSQESMMYHKVTAAVMNSATPQQTRVGVMVLSKTNHANEAKNVIVAHIRLELFTVR